MIDTHFHLWRRAEAKQDGILGAGYLQRDFLWSDLVSATAGLPLEGGVKVQVNDFTDGTIEARRIAEVAAGHPELGAYVAWAQLESPRVEDELDALARLPIVRGVRRTLQIEADPRFCLRPDYVRGARRLGRRGLLCEICVRFEQVSALPRLARACPETTFVLQHLGKPDVTRPPEAYWLRAIEELGALENVAGKLSVVVQRADDPPLAAERLEPFITHLVACFGPRRLVFGSNWPVATAVVEYRDWVAMLEQLLPGDEAARAAIFAGNARRLYRL